MKISRIEIQAFRSIKKATLDINKLNILVGENNSGKSTILRALNSFFNFELEEKLFLNEAHRHNPRSNTHIILEFSDINKKWAFPSIKINDGKLKVKFIYRYKDHKRELKYFNGKWSNILDHKEFFEELSRHISYVYISTNRTQNNIIWNENSLLRALVSNHMDKHTENRDSLSTKIRRETESIYKNALKSLEKQINQLNVQGDYYKYSFRFDDKLDYSTLLNHLEVSVLDKKNSFTHFLGDWGSGTISLAVIGMYRANAQILGTQVVLGIEEPEMNLHPQAQKRFVQALNSTLQKNEIQTIMTTHSTVIIDEVNEPNNIILVKRKKGEDRGFISELHRLDNAFWENNDLTLDGYKRFFNIKNSDIFFSKYVIICESSNDELIIRKLLKEKLKHILADISFVTLNGVNNLNYPLLILDKLKIKYVVILDKDYFYDYKNKELDNSRDSKGFPIYKNELTSICTKRSVIDKFFSNDEKKRLESKQNSYREIWKILSKKGFLIMHYNLETDLVSSAKCREKFYQILNIPENAQSERTLLKNNYKAIKKRENLIDIMAELNPRDYPESFSKIKNYIVEDTQKLV